MNLPKAKSENIVVNNLRNELLIYDLSTNKALCLNDTSAKVFNACDGTMTFDQLKTKHQLTDEIVYLALDGLRKENLLESDYVSLFAGMSRREAIRKVGLASMIALPVVSAIVAPTAAQAASGIAAPAGCVAPNAGGAAGGSSTTMSGDVTTLKNSCLSCCYRDYNPGSQTGTCCNNCGEARCQ